MRCIRLTAGFTWLVVLFLVGRGISLGAQSTRDVSWESDGARLVGTLYVPQGNGPFPTVVLVHAAGKSTRKDWPYRDHAEYLSQRGIAVFVYDKRGTGESGGTYDRFIDADVLVDDAIGAVNAVRSLPEVDARRLGMWGRSQGAWVVVKAAARSSAVRFVIPVAGGSARPIDQELWVQRYWLKKSGISDAGIDQAERTSGLVWSYYATGQGRVEAQRALDSLRAQPWFDQAAGSISGYPRSGQLEPPDWVLANAKSALRWQSGLLWDPAEQLKELQVPVLGIFGGSDTITPTELSAARMEESGVRNGRQTFKVVVFPGAAHSLCPAEPPEKLVDGCAPVAGYLPLLASWIAELPSALQR